MPLGENVAEKIASGFKVGALGESLGDQRAEAANLSMLEDKQQMFKAQLAETLSIQDDRRMQAFATDIRKANVLAENGNFEQLGQLLENRSAILKKQGVSSKETDGFSELLMQASTGDQQALDKLLNNLASAELQFVAGGLIDPRTDQHKKALGLMAKPDPIKKFFETDAGLIGVSAQGKATDIDLGGAKIKEKTNPYQDTLISLQIETIKLQQQQTRGKIDDKKAEKLQKKIDLKESAYNELYKSSTILGTLDDLLEGDTLESSAGWQDIFPTVPGSDVAGFESQLETLKSQLFLQGVKQLKGMGALSEAEGRKIAAAVGSLDISMGDALLRREITRIRNDIRRAVKATENKIKAGKFEFPSGYAPLGKEGAGKTIGRFTVEVVN